MSATFERVSWLKYGYDIEEVDDFFELARAAYEGAPHAELDSEQIQQVVFDLVRRGYKCDVVDAALDRLASAMIAKERVGIVGALGQQAWNEKLAQSATTLYPRLTRPRGERFRPTANRHGYDMAEVDDLLDRLTAYFDAGEPLSAQEIQHAAFRRRRQGRGYDEASVDAFLRRASRVLLGVQ